MDDERLRAALLWLDPQARSQLRRLLIRNQANRNHVAQQALQRRALGLADIVDLLTLDDDIRRRVARLLGELDASN